MLKSILRSGRFLLSVCVVLAASESAHATGPTATEMAERLRGAQTSTSLDVGPLKPWHLKLAVQLYEKGSPVVAGSVEVWWAGPSLRRAVYRIPEYKVTQKVNGKDEATIVPEYRATYLLNESGSYRTRGAALPPGMVDLLLEQVIHPMPRQAEIDASSLRFAPMAKPALDCIALRRTPKAGEINPDSVPFPTYCFDPGGEGLRLTNAGAALSMLRVKVGVFQGRSVPISSLVNSLSEPVGTDIATMRSTFSVPEASASIASLSTVVLSGSDFEVTSDLEAMPVEPLAVRSNDMYSRLLFLSFPTASSYSSDHEFGSISLEVIIGRDGHVKSTNPVPGSPNALILQAEDAIRGRIYRPCLVNGQAVEVSTTMVINYLKMKMLP